ncbi:hypothetical protein, partial [Rubripirellula obstinata]|uniref:hypothetical protein n=1 Tax=Rubripirellula obstinata TaxID=406547 RepID=UPI0013903A6F
GACNGYPQYTIAMRSVSADFVPVGDSHRGEDRSKERSVKQVSVGSVKSSVQGRALVVPRSASGASVLSECWLSGVG